MPTVYIASKSAHGARWRTLRAAGFPIISTWIDESGDGETKSWSDLWRRCVSEAAAADFTILYRHPGEYLKGALVEVGAALAAGKQVIIVGCGDLSFRFHPNVIQALDLRDAFEFVTNYGAPTVAPRRETKFDDPHDVALAAAMDVPVRKLTAGWRVGADMRPELTDVVDDTGRSVIADPTRHREAMRAMVAAAGSVQS